MHYLNVKIDALKEAASKSVLDKQPVWFSADVSKDQDSPRHHGGGDPRLRLDFRRDGQADEGPSLVLLRGHPNHAMVLMGVDLRKEKPVKWLVENSWGKEHGHEGYWSLYDNWFNENLYTIVVKKTYVPRAC